MKTRLDKRREVYKNPFGGEEGGRRGKHEGTGHGAFNVKHVSQAQLTGTRPMAKGAVRRHRPAWPGKPYPAAAGLHQAPLPGARSARRTARGDPRRRSLPQTGRCRPAPQEMLCATLEVEPRCPAPRGEGPCLPTLCPPRALAVE